MHSSLLQGNSSGAKPRCLTAKYDGDWDDKLLDDFFWDVDEYLSTTKGVTDDAQLKQVMAYFTGNAKLWWQTHLGDERAGRPT